MPGDEKTESAGEAEHAPRDGTLAVRAGEGDEDAFETLVHRHAPALLRLATRLLGNRAEAEDAVQEGLVSAWRKLPEFRQQASFQTWIYRIVSNRCLNTLRGRRPVADLDSIKEPAAPEHLVSPERSAESNAAAKALFQALGMLSPEQRVCWVLREMDGLSYEEIAETVGIRPQAVRGRVFRARRGLTEAMGAWR